MPRRDLRTTPSQFGYLLPIGVKGAYLGGEELVKHGEDRLERHSRISDRVDHPAWLRFFLVLEAEPLEEGNNVGCAAATASAARRIGSTAEESFGHTEGERDIRVLEPLAELRHFGRDGINRIIRFLLLGC